VQWLSAVPDAKTAKCPGSQARTAGRSFSARTSRSSSEPAAVAYLASSWADGVLVASAGLLPLAAASLDRFRDDVLAYAVLFASSQ
jgi:hypothetical protein